MSTFLKTGLFIKVNGRMRIVMGMECKYGQMAPSMKDSGEIIKLMVRGSFGMPMAMFLTVSGRMIRLMGMESILMSMVLNMKVSGKMISSMAEE